MEWLAALILPVLAGFVASRIARDKGRSPALWRWLTFFCCPLLILLMLLPAKGAAGGGIATEAFAAALIILALVGAGIYAVSGSRGGATPRPPSADCDRVRDDAQCSLRADGSCKLASANIHHRRNVGFPPTPPVQRGGRK